MPKLSPVVFAQHARDFLDAATREQARQRIGVSIPAYFLAARAIELALKAFLLLKGDTEKDLRAVSHDLAKALDRATSLGLGSAYNVRQESDEAVRWINEYYAIKDLEYLTTGYKSYPEFQYLETFASELLSSLAPRLRAWRPSAP